MTRRGGPTRSRVSPALVGRVEALTLGMRRWQEALGGSGTLLVLVGEAGIGKSRMLSEIAERVGDARVLSMGAYPRESLVVGGVVLTLADDLVRAGDTSTATTLRRILNTESDLESATAGSRRQLIAAITDALESVLEREPVLLLVEDLHWADQVSLDVLGRLAAALASVPCLVVATVRSDEPGSESLVAGWKARLLAQRHAEEVRLKRLGRDDVEQMATAITHAPLTAAALDDIVRRSDGIPFHVEELLASGSETVPETIAESVRARVATLTHEAQNVLFGASVIGRSFAAEMLSAVVAAPTDDVDRVLGVLVDQHFVAESSAGDGFVFRHALLCDAVYGTIPVHRRRELHALVAQDSVRRGLAVPMISDHFERARSFDEAYRHAVAGARIASRRSAHREAAALYQRALRTAPTSMTAITRARLLAALGAELLAADDAGDAAIQLAAAIQLFRERRDELAGASLVPALMEARHLLGAGREERVALAHDALTRLDAHAGEASGTAVRGALLAAIAAAHMLDRRLEDAAEYSERAATVLNSVAPVEKVSDPVTVSLEATLGSVMIFAGQSDAGWRRLESAIQLAESAGFEREAARAHRMVGSSASMTFDYARAERSLARGLEYSSRVERWNDHHYLLAHSAHVRWAVGDWDAAADRAHRALQAGDGITTRITALHVLGYVAVGRGHWDDARVSLDESRFLAEGMGELQRLSPSWWGLAELALGRGDVMTAESLSERALSASLAVNDAAYLLPFVVTGTRAHLASIGAESANDWLTRCSMPLRLRGLPATTAALEHARGLIAAARGDQPLAWTLLQSAARSWAGIDRWWEGTTALIDGSRVAQTLGDVAAATAAATRARLRAETVGAAPMIVAATAVIESPESHQLLTARELDVARFIAMGATNRTIADTLSISPKTVSAHVEHILTKLGAARRAEIAAWVVRTGQ